MHFDNGEQFTLFYYRILLSNSIIQRLYFRLAYRKALFLTKKTYNFKADMNWGKRCYHIKCRYYMLQN